MKVTRKDLLYKSFFTMVLLFAIYGCQTTNNSVTPEQTASTVKSGPIQVDVESADNEAAGLSQTSEAEIKSTEASTTEISSDLEKERLGKFKNAFSRLTVGHGGGANNDPADTKGPTENASVGPDVVEDRPFVELEKKLYGKWINDKETESYDFHNDGNVTITVTAQRDISQKLNGHYKLVEEGRIKIEIKEGPFARIVPTRHFKISISENEFTLTDEPKKTDGPDGPTTVYRRVE